VDRVIPTHDFVIIVRPEIDSTDYHGLEKECRRKLDASYRRKNQRVGENPALFD
jgi:RNase P protein component